MNEAMWAIIGGIVTGISLKSADHIFSRLASKTQESTQLRQELRQDLKDCKQENDRLEKECEELRVVIQKQREDYFALKYPRG